MFPHQCFKSNLDVLLVFWLFSTFLLVPDIDDTSDDISFSVSFCFYMFSFLFFLALFFTRVALEEGWAWH